MVESKGRLERLGERGFTRVEEAPREGTVVVGVPVVGSCHENAGQRCVGNGQVASVVGADTSLDRPVAHRIARDLEGP